MPSAPRILDLALTLGDVEPPVWRVLRVSAGATLARAQRLICVCFGWPGGRRYAFEGDGFRHEGAGRAAELTGVRLRQLLPDVGAEMEFEYGDAAAWIVHARVARVLPPDDGSIVTPRCVAGEGASPPIDAGGALVWNERAHADDGEGDASGSVRPRVRVPLDLINAELDRVR